jgi:hypothetical protein
LHYGLCLPLGHHGAQGAQVLAEDRSGRAESLEQAAAMHAAYAGRQLEPQPGA